MSEVIEDNIIKERVSVNEISYKRIVKSCQSLYDSDINSTLKDSIALEFDHEANLFAKLQVQLGVGSNEIAVYQEKTKNTNIQIKELELTTQQLEAELAAAQKLKNQREECNNLIASMLRAKKVLVDNTPIIALLDSSRQDDEVYCASLEEEIQELEEQKIIYQQLWDSRKTKFDQLVKYLQQFKQDINESGKLEEQEEESDTARGQSIEKEESTVESNKEDTPMTDS